MVPAQFAAEIGGGVRVAPDAAVREARSFCADQHRAVSPDGTFGLSGAGAIGEDGIRSVRGIIGEWGKWGQRGYAVAHGVLAAKTHSKKKTGRKRPVSVKTCE